MQKILKHAAYVLAAILAGAAITAIQSPALVSFVENHGVSAVIFGLISTAVVSLLVAAESYLRAKGTVT
jgi:hypothetical protein